MAIKSFKAENAFLSNFYPSPILLNDHEVYATVEHAFQAAKAVRADDRERIRTAITPGIAKRRGRTVALRSDWESIKLDVMLNLLRIKFASNTSLAARLLDTSDEYLEEGNDHGDRFWGSVAGQGQNHLGRLLMQVREELRALDKKHNLV